MMKRRPLLVAAGLTVVCAFAGAIVALALLFNSGGASSLALRLTLQPADLPSDFFLAEERLYSRGEMLAELPADTQIAEAGLKEAVKRTFHSQDDEPTVIAVSVYVYEDDDTAETAHSHRRESQSDFLQEINLQDGRSGFAFEAGLVTDGLGDGAWYMTGQVESGTPTDDEMFSGTPIHAYFLRNGNFRAEVMIVGHSIFLDPERVARNQYLRLDSPQSLLAP